MKIHSKDENMIPIFIRLLNIFLFAQCRALSTEQYPILLVQEINMILYTKHLSKYSNLKIHSYIQNHTYL